MLRQPLLLLLPLVVAHIEDLNPEIKPSTIRPFIIPETSDYDFDLSPVPAHIYLGRSRRAVHDPVSDFLDAQAAAAVFGDNKAGPSMASPVNYNRVPEKHVNSGTASFSRGFETPAPPPPPPPPPPPSMSKFKNGLGNVIPPSSTRLVPYDLHIDPDFPVDAPRARGLVNIPEGWNTNRQIDWEFKAGYRWNKIPSGAASSRNYEIGSRGRFAPFAVRRRLLRY